VKARWVLPWLLGLVLSAPCPAGEAVTLYLFYSERCVNCAREKEFLAGLQKRLPGLNVRSIEVQADPASARLLVKVSEAFGVPARGVPVTFIGHFEPIIGFQDGETTGRLIEQRVRECLASGCEDVVGRLLGDIPGAPASLAEPHTVSRSPGKDDAAAMRGKGTTPPLSGAAGAGGADTVLTLPLFGRTDLSSQPLLVLTVILGALDSFNPCAFFVLFTLLGILVHARSRRRMLFIGGVFVLFSGIVYFAFMAAWLNVFLHIGELHAVTVAAGLVALCVGGINVKDFFRFKQGISLTIPESRKPSLFERMRALLHETSLPAIVLGTVVLALAANTYELLCTAGFPMVFTRILTLNQLRPVEYYLLLGLYNVVYVLPLVVVVAVFSLTLGSRKLSESQGRVLKLVSGLMMLGLGAVILLDPGLFNNVLVGVALLAFALVAAAAIVGLERRWEAMGGVK
jgi:hypothetical protein